MGLADPVGNVAAVALMEKMDAAADDLNQEVDKLHDIIKEEE